MAAAVLFSWPGAAHAQDRDRFARALDAFAAQAMQRLEAVPGMAVAVVDDQGVVLTAGYGLADVRTGAPATPRTRFYIASTTKALTALGIAAMDARGEVDIDAPLSTWSPSSGVPDDLAAQVTLTDLLSHRSGVINEAIAFRVAFSGSRTHVSFMPERRLGVAMMVNEDGFGRGLADLVANYAYDWFAEMPDIDAVYEARLAELIALRDRRREGYAASLQARAERPRTLGLPDEAYVGDFVSAAYGAMAVRPAEGGLVLAIGVQHAVAQAGSDPETVRVELTPFVGQAVTFIFDSQGRPQSLTYDGQTFVRR